MRLPGMSVHRAEQGVPWGANVQRSKKGKEPAREMEEVRNEVEQEHIASLKLLDRML
jgi:hypothetical protein